MKNRVLNNIALMGFFLLFGTTLFATIYEDNYKVTNSIPSTVKNDNTFMNETFEEIYRYEMIVIEDDSIAEESRTLLKKIIDDIKILQDNKRDFKVTLIGHTQRYSDDMNENKIQSKTYVRSIELLFEDSFDRNESLQKSKEYVEKVEKKILDENISKSFLLTEFRGAKDEVYTQCTAEGEKYSNGVFISIYIIKLQDIDSDRDGVFDRYDRCPATPRGSIVDKNGCPVDSDKDGVIDFKDACPKTPIGVKVDKKGCPLDSDGDGIVDYKDRCAKTPLGISVDPNGCALKSTLKLNFKRNSDKILQDSYPEIQRFAAFLKKNRGYKAEIIGHTDSVGKAVVNMKLSQRRAATTKEALVKEGVEASRLTTRGRGELDPIASNKSKSGRKENRRIEVKLILEEVVE